jgi:tRNA(Ile)-lysidine synthase TilS/MesJ
MSKLEKTIELIRAGFSVPNRSALAWSGGKDSMVLFHILHTLGIKLPVVFFKEP